jgi:hypothetical protein
MKNIITIPQIQLIDKMYPKWAKYTVILVLFLFLIISVLNATVLIGLFDKTQVDFNIKLNLFLSAAFLFLIFALLSYTFFKERVYKPKKSFAIERFNKRKLNKIVKAIIVIYALLFLWDVYSFGFGVTKRIGGYIFTFIALYYVLKSIKYHENVDYSANQDMIELLGMDINEKITSSYQNFDGLQSNFKKGDSIIVTTNRKIYFAQFNGNKFKSLNRFFGEIDRIGILRKLEESFILLVFEDKTTLCLKLNVFDKITTAPQLFISQFLRSLDSYLLGENNATIANRRRITTSNENTSELNKFSNQLRSIELSQTLINKLKLSEEIKSGRILEI